MAEDGETDFQSGDSGASLTYPAKASAIRKNGHMLIKGKPCKIVEMSTSKTGKHGHAKIHFVGLDIISGNKYEDIVPSTHNVDVPNIKREEYTLSDISYEGHLSLLSDSGIIRADLNIPENELGADMKAKFEKEEDILVQVLTVMDKAIINGIKSNRP